MGPGPDRAPRIFPLPLEYSLSPWGRGTGRGQGEGAGICAQALESAIISGSHGHTPWETLLYRAHSGGGGLIRTAPCNAAARDIIHKENTMRHYEVVFLVHPDQSEQVPAMIERYKS